MDANQPRTGHLDENSEAEFYRANDNQNNLNENNFGAPDGAENNRGA